MQEWQIPGAINLALTHFAMVGVAQILAEHDESPVRLWWSEEIEPVATLANDGGPDAAAHAVHEHAVRHTRSDSWIQAKLSSGPRAGAAIFTPRGGWPGPSTPTAEGWSTYLAERRASRAATELTLLDELFMAALGEPAWWRSPGNDDRPDDGASRWEMKTRNRGSEIIKERILPLADAVSARDAGDVKRGLLGEAIVDETGKNASDSRTATGLATPRPTDSAIAWCALWGLSVTRVVRRWTGSPGPGNFRGVSATSGIAGRSKTRIGDTHPTDAALPVFTRPVTARRWGDVLASRQFFDTAFMTGDVGEQNPVEALASRGWLREQSVRALVRFPILKTGSASAPERQVLDGTLEEL